MGQVTSVKVQQHSPLNYASIRTSTPKIYLQYMVENSTPNCSCIYVCVGSWYIIRYRSF